MVIFNVLSTYYMLGISFIHFISISKVQVQSPLNSLWYVPLIISFPWIIGVSVISFRAKAFKDQNLL